MNAPIFNILLSTVTAESFVGKGVTKDIFKNALLGLLKPEQSQLFSA